MTVYCFLYATLLSNARGVGLNLVLYLIMYKNFKSCSIKNYLGEVECHLFLDPNFFFHKLKQVQCFDPIDPTRGLIIDWCSTPPK